MNEESENEKVKKRHDRFGRTPMLTLIFKDKSRRSFAYAYLLECKYKESEKNDGILLNFGFKTVKMYGERIENIYRDIVTHTADEINEIDPADLSPTHGGIIKIDITPHEKDSK